MKEFSAGPGKSESKMMYYVSGMTSIGSMRIFLVPESGVKGKFTGILNAAAEAPHPYFTAAREELTLVFSCQPYSVEPVGTTAPDSLWNESMAQLRSFVVEPTGPEAERYWGNKYDTIPTRADVCSIHLVCRAGGVHLDGVSISDAAPPIPVAAASAAGTAPAGPVAPRGSGRQTVAAPPKPKAVKSTSASSFFGGGKAPPKGTSKPAASAAPQAAKQPADPPSTWESRMSTASRKRAEERAKRDATLFDDEDEDTSKLGVSASGARSKAELDAAKEETAAPVVARKRPRKDVVDDSDSDDGADEGGDKVEEEAAKGAPKKARGGAKKAPASGKLGDIPAGQYEEMGLKRDKKGNIVLPEADAAVMDAFVEGEGGSAAPAGKKSQKLVEYTYMDESGYMVTSKKEGDPAAATAPSASAGAAKKKPAAPSAAANKPKSSAGKPKVAKQAGLMSFFGKK